MINPLENCNLFPAIEAFGNTRPPTRTRSAKVRHPENRLLTPVPSAASACLSMQRRRGTKRMTSFVQLDLPIAAQLGDHVSDVPEMAIATAVDSNQQQVHQAPHPAKSARHDELDTLIEQAPSGAARPATLAAAAGADRGNLGGFGAQQENGKQYPNVTPGAPVGKRLDPFGVPGQSAAPSGLAATDRYGGAVQTQRPVRALRQVPRRARCRGPYPQRATTRINCGIQFCSGVASHRGFEPLLPP